MNILQIHSSPRPDAVSTRLAEELGQALAGATGATRLIRDLGAQPHPMLDGAALHALHTPAAQRTPDQAERVARDDALIAELLAADALVLAAPMYNFGIPAQLKAWVDAICRAGVTFQYADPSSPGLVRGKTVYVVTTRGGVHRDAPMDQVVPYLRMVLGFLGMQDVRVLYAEGLAMGPDSAAQAMEAARAQIRTWASAAKAAA